MLVGMPLVYKVEDRSILLPYYRRYVVDPFLPWIPAKVSPNAITHLGHLLNLGGTALLVGLYPTRGPVFFLAMILLQIYLWCDNADGAHARRTDQCSPLGELLDHGLDQLNMVYIALLSCMALGLAPIHWVLIAIIIPATGPATYWEQSETGTMRVGMLNQVESVFVLSSVLTLSGFLGNDFWARTTLFGVVSLQRGFLIWVTAQILFSVFRNAQRVASEAGLARVLPIMPFLAFGAAIMLAAITGALSVVTSVTLAVCLNVYFGMRMLTQRLHEKLPKVEPVLVAASIVVAGVIGLHAITRKPIATSLDHAIAIAACAIFGALAIRDTRKNLALLSLPTAR